MSKTRIVTVFGLVALLGLAACGGDADEQVMEEPAVDASGEPVVDPGVMEGAIMMDTATLPQTPADSAS